MDIALTVALIFAAWWAIKKAVKRITMKDIPTSAFDLTHASFAALLAELSLRGYVADAMAGIVIYLVYQIISYLINHDTVQKDIAVFAGVYFATLASQVLLY